MKGKLWISFLILVCLSSVCLSGCIHRKTASSQGTNIIKKAEPQEGDTSETKNFEVELDKRPGKTKYQYDMDDLSFVDTVTGKKVIIGMTSSEIEAIAGQPITDAGTHCVYDGLIVQYENDQSVALIVSGGLFTNEAQSTRFMSSRGVGLRTGYDDFVKAYGDLYNEGEQETTQEGETIIKSLDSAVRYFMVDGTRVEFLGTKLTEEMKQQYAGKLYMQDFSFEHAENKLTTMRVVNMDYVSNY